MSDYYPSAEKVLPLFAKPAARASDPPTSHRAARRVPQRGHALKVLEALAAGPAGQTEIARRTGLTVAAVSKRLPELRRDGFVEYTARLVEGGECEYRRCQ